MIWARARFLHALILARDVNVNALTLWRISLIRLQQRERAFINNLLNPDLSSSQPAPRSLFHIALSTEKSRNLFSPSLVLKRIGSV